MSGARLGAARPNRATKQETAKQKSLTWLSQGHSTFPKYKKSIMLSNHM
jgi:hypothetical protein